MDGVPSKALESCLPNKVSPTLALQARINDVQQLDLSLIGTSRRTCRLGQPGTDKGYLLGQQEGIRKTIPSPPTHLIFWYRSQLSGVRQSRSRILTLPKPGSTSSH